jgi:preprotein translocase SecF subunit
MIDFLRYRAIAAVLSVVIIAGFGVTYFYKAQTRETAFLYSIDFTGGTQVLLQFDKPVGIAQLQKIVENAGWKNPALREFKATEILVRVKDFSNDAKGVARRMVQAVVSAMPGVKVQDLTSESIGSGIGEELRWNAVKAVVISLIALLFYIMFSFWSFAFALGAVVSLAHDTLVMLASILLLDREMSIIVIGAILAILGYSINDTIVVFARIRKNIKEMKDASIEEIVNVSINGTLRRTILTSFATMLVVLSMVFLGGEVLRDFSLTLLLGIVFGTYSSVYIASTIMILFYKKKVS